MTNRTNKILFNIPIFEKATVEIQESLLEKAHKLTHKKGKIIFFYGDRAEYYYYINKGHIKIFRETPDGKQAVIDVLSKGEIIGACSIFESSTYQYTAELIEQSEIVSLPISDLKNAIMNTPEIAYGMMSYLAKYKHRAEKRIEHISIQNASQRIACNILQLATKNANPTNNHVEIKLPYDKMLIASLNGIQPETFSRALSRLKKDTGITSKGLNIYVNDMKRLSDYCCSSCSQKLPCNK